MIFYFSGTGNTLWAAQKIASTTGDTLISIAEAQKKGLTTFNPAEGERIGFCFPTHGWQPPRLVREFIRNITIASANQYCWALTTCGDNMGEAMTILGRELLTKGLRLSATFAIVMPESYVCLPFMHTDPKEHEQQKIAAASDALGHIATMIASRKQGVEQLVKGATPRLYSYVIGQYFNRHMITDRKFMVDPEKCTKCGKCRRMCPVDNILGTPPMWKHNGKCTCCLACYHHCPVHAINYGERTRKRGQYYFGI